MKPYIAVKNCEKELILKSLGEKLAFETESALQEIEGSRCDFIHFHGQIHSGKSRMAKLGQLFFNWKIFEPMAVANDLKNVKKYLQLGNICVFDETQAMLNINAIIREYNKFNGRAIFISQEEFKKETLINWRVSYYLSVHFYDHLYSPKIEIKYTAD